MKKVYVKPMIYYESFASSTNLAAGCEKIVGTPSMYLCGITTSDPDTVYFAYPVDGSLCNEEGRGDMMTYDNFCYQNPSDGNNLFNS